MKDMDFETIFVVFQIQKWISFLNIAPPKYQTLR
jgi:hypothetical protein